MIEIGFIVYGDIPSMKNDLGVMRGKNGKPIFYHKGNGVRYYKELFDLQVPSKFKVCLNGKISVYLRIFKKDNRKDGCNMSGAVYDALQSSGVIKNDRNITLRIEEDFIDKENPRVEVVLKKKGETGMTLNFPSEILCVQCEEKARVSNSVFCPNCKKVIDDWNRKIKKEWDMPEKTVNREMKYQRAGLKYDNVEKGVK